MPDDVLAEAKALLSEGYLAPLYAGILRTAVERADLPALKQTLPRMQERAAKVREEVKQALADDKARRRKISEALLAEHGRKKLERMLARVEAAQERRYKRWALLRPGERTARRAYLSNALDAGAREINTYKEALALEEPSAPSDPGAAGSTGPELTRTMQ